MKGKMFRGEMLLIDSCSSYQILLKIGIDYIGLPLLKLQTIVKFLLIFVNIVKPIFGAFLQVPALAIS